MKHKWFIKILNLSLCASLILTPTTALGASSSSKKDEDKIDYKIINETKPVAPDKIWTIKFNRELDSDTVKYSNVYIEDSDDERVSSKVTLSKDKKEITINSYSNYTQGKRYHIILKDLKSKKGKKLIKPNKIYFNVNNVYAGLPSEEGLVIIKDTAYSIEYLAKHSSVRNELLKDDYNVYYAYSYTADRIKEIIKDKDITGSTVKPTHYTKMIYIDGNGDKTVYKWDSDTSEYKKVKPEVDADITVNSNAKVVMIKVNSVEGVDGATYFRIGHTNTIKRIGESVVFSSTNYSEDIDILSSSKNVLASGGIFTLYTNEGTHKLTLANANEGGNATSNINNNGYVTEDNYGYVYFNNTSDGDKLYKKDTNGMFYNAICNDNAQYINVLNGWVYYSNYSEGGKLYKVKTDGTGRQKMNDDMSAYINISGDWIYYSNHSDGGKLYKIRTNGTGRGRVSEYLDNEVAYINSVGNWIYYTDINDRHRPYVINKEGSYVCKLSDEWADSIQVEGDWIYYTSSTGVLSKLKKDGTGSIIPIIGQTREFDKGFHINVIDGWIYYSNYKDSGRLYKVRTDGSGTKVKLTTETVDYINIAGYTIFYTSKGKLYNLPIDADGSTKGKPVEKAGNNNKIIQMNDLKVTVPYYDVNLTLNEIENKYLPEKVPGIKDDNTMHQFSVDWDRKKVTVRNGIRTYKGEVIGFNRTVKLELEIPSEMLNESNTITIYNNPGKRCDVVEVKNLYDNNLHSNPPKLNIGDEVKVYDNEDCDRALGKGKVIRKGKENIATVSRIELDNMGQKSVWITVTRAGKGESRPTEVKQADMPVILTVKDNDDTGFGIDGRDFTIDEWLPSLKERLDSYYVYMLPSRRKLDMSEMNLNKLKAIKGYGDVDSDETLYGVESLSHFVRSNNKGEEWTGERNMIKDSSLNEFRRGKYDLFVAGRYENYASSDNRGKKPKVIGYISSEPATLDLQEEGLPDKPTLTRTRVQGGTELVLPRALKSGETAWLVPTSTLNSIKNWKREDGFRESDLDLSNADNANGLKPESLVYDGVTKIIKAPKGMEAASPEYKDIECKLIYVNSVGASLESNYSVIVDNKAPEVSFIGSYESIYLGDNIVARSTEDGEIYLIAHADSANSRDQLDDAVKAKRARSVSVRNDIGYDIKTSGLEGNVKLDDRPNPEANYKVVAIDEAGNISESKDILIWVTVFELDKIISEATDASLSDVLDADRRNELVSAIQTAKDVRNKVAGNNVGVTTVTQKEINTAFDTLKYKMMNLGVASKFASIDEILRAEQNALQDMVINGDTKIPYKSSFIKDDDNVRVDIDWNFERDSDRKYIAIENSTDPKDTENGVIQKGVIKIVNRPAAEDIDITLRATITVRKDGVTKPVTKKVIVTVKRADLVISNIEEDKSDNVKDGIRKIKVEWNIDTNAPHHFEIVASTNGTPTLRDTVPVKTMNNDWAEFEFETTETGRALYVAVVVIDDKNKKSMSEPVPITIAGEIKATNP